MQVFCEQYARLLIAIPYSDKGTQRKANSSTQNKFDNLTALNWIFNI